MIEIIFDFLYQAWLVFMWFIDFILNLKYYYFYIPFFFLLFWFLETFAIVWYLIPMEVITISVFAVLVDYKYLIIFSSFFLWVWIFLWLIVWYIFWYYFLKSYLKKLEENYPTIKQYFINIDKKIENNHIYAFPLILNIWFLRPLFSVHLWARKYNFKKYLIWSIIWTISYVIPRLFLWILIWIFWKIIVDYVSIWYKYILIFIFLLIIFSFIIDIFKSKRKFKKY